MYIHEGGYDIIAISEQWLWPFKSDRLCIVHPAFNAEVNTDARISEKCESPEGLWGCGVYVEKDSECHSHSLYLQRPNLWTLCKVASPYCG